MRKFVECDREQAFLLPPDLRDWVAPDDLAHFMIEAVERVDMGAFKANVRGTGSAQCLPRIMLALSVCGYTNRIFEPPDRARDAARHRCSLCGGEPPHRTMTR